MLHASHRTCYAAGDPRYCPRGKLPGAGRRSKGAALMLARGSASTRIAAPPERVWELVADVTRMGEWSPECYRCEWLSVQPGPRVGAHFRGHNRQGPFRWSLECVVTACTPGQDFAFSTLRSEERRVGKAW